MIRIYLALVAFLLFFAFLFNSAPMGKKIKADECIECHVNVYEKATSSLYKHSVVRNGCPSCHIVPAFPGADKRGKLIASSADFHNEELLYLGTLSENREYHVEIRAVDSSGRSLAPNLINIIPENVSDFPDEFSLLKKISNVKAKKIKKAVFVEATISWVTDAPATSEIEYGLTREFGDRVSLENILLEKHEIIINGLGHKRKYFYRVISKDIQGNVLWSDIFTFDTSKEFTLTKKPKKEDHLTYLEYDVKTFRTGKNKDYYLKLSSNKLTRFKVWMKEIDKKHGEGFFMARYTTIDVCVECHSQGASHPVGGRAKGPKIKIPDWLPTIGKGIMTCVTCHYPHGSKKPFLGRIVFNKNMCFVCHKGDYY